jgi:hypothetical protein
MFASRVSQSSKQVQHLHAMQQTYIHQRKILSLGSCKFANSTTHLISLEEQSPLAARACSVIFTIALVLHAARCSCVRKPLRWSATVAPVLTSSVLFACSSSPQLLSSNSLAISTRAAATQTATCRRSAKKLLRRPSFFCEPRAANAASSKAKAPGGVMYQCATRAHGHSKGSQRTNM